MEINGTIYHDGTPLEIVRYLECARLNNSSVRLFYGDPKTGVDWGEENDVTGRIGRSPGLVGVPILLHDSVGLGGGIIRDNNILRLIVDGDEVYRAPNYRPPVYIVVVDPVSDCTGPLFAHVYRDGNNAGNFETEEEARQWIAFMIGERLTK